MDCHNYGHGINPEYYSRLISVEVHSTVQLARIPLGLADATSPHTTGTHAALRTVTTSEGEARNAALLSELVSTATSDFSGICLR